MRIWFRRICCLTVLALWCVVISPFLAIDFIGWALKLSADRWERFAFWVDGTRPAIATNRVFTRCMDSLCVWCDRAKPRSVR